MSRLDRVADTLEPRLDAEPFWVGRYKVERYSRTSSKVSETVEFSQVKAIKVRTKVLRTGPSRSTVNLLVDRLGLYNSVAIGV